MLKQCIECKQLLPETEFYYRKDRKQYYSPCKQCIKNRSNQYYRNHREKKIKYAIEYNKEYRKKPERQKKDREYNKLYRKANPEWLKERNKKDAWKRVLYAKNHPEKIAKIQKKFREKYKREHGEDISTKYYPRYKEKVREKIRRRHLKKKQLFEDFTQNDIQNLIKKTGELCPFCQRPFEEVFPYCATVDHTPPISKAQIGFHYKIENISIICGSCNSSKGTKLKKIY